MGHPFTRSMAVAAAIGVSAASAVAASAAAPAQPELATRTTPLLASRGLQFKDLNRNGRLDGYEDWRRSPEVRARDLVRRMTLAEKAGLMVHHTAPSTTDASGNPIY